LLAAQEREREEEARMSWLVGPGADVWQAAVKVVLLFVTAVVGFRFGVRRTFAELAPLDIVAVISAGAIVGRTATAAGTAFLVGVAALAVLLVTHRAVGRLRRYRPIAAVVDQPIRLLVANGKIDERELYRTGLTREDLYGVLRTRGVRRLSDVRFLLYENKGAFSTIGWDQQVNDEPVASALRSTAYQSAVADSR
jgi:uncharacterized membrane protein YcaP (DUF421 family)